MIKIDYAPPRLEVFEIETEKGFAASPVWEDNGNGSPDIGLGDGADDDQFA